MPLKRLKKTKVLVLEIGGTISHASTNATDEFYNNPVGNLESFISEFNLNKNVEVVFQQYKQKISHEFTIPEILELGKIIQILLDDCDGIIITSGTNALEEISYFIGLIVKSSKPIVFTGAHLAQNNLGYDGKRNLYNAIIIVLSNSASELGVLVTFNDHVVTARDATKCHHGLINNFSFDGIGVIGHVIGGTFLLKSRPVYRHTYKSELQIDSINDLPKVPIIYNHLGMDDLFIKVSIESGVSGIISAGFGKGYNTTNTSLSLQSAINHGVSVVRCARSGYSYTNVDPDYDGKYGFIVAKGLSPHKSRILLSLALVVTKDREHLQKIFEEY